MEHRGLDVDATALFGEGIAECNTGAPRHRVDSILGNTNAARRRVVDAVQVPDEEFRLRFQIERSARAVEAPAGFNGERRTQDHCCVFEAWEDILF